MAKPHFSVAVLVSAGRNPVSGSPRACPGDAVAMSLGRKIAGDALRVVFAGSQDEPALMDYLALGAGTIEVVSCSSSSDIVAALATKLSDVDVILTGTRTESGAGSGVVPYALAAALKRPVVANVLDAIIDRGEARVTQFLPKGLRRSLATQLPAIFSVHPMAPLQLTYAHARRATGRIVNSVSGDSGGELDIHRVPQWAVTTTERRLLPLKAEVKMNAHDRLQSAISQEAKGGVVAIDGTCVDKAQVVLAYLRENRLIDF
jgi:electron transfer flavoprotein beta subunit